MIYQKCPDCDKAGVSFRLRPNGEDHYGCRYCCWQAFTQGYEQQDREQLARLEETNRQKRSPQ